MLWIGITGGIGTGKSSVSNILSELGYEVLNADEVAKSFLASGSEAFADIKQNFGADILDLNGEIDKSKLAQVVFQNKANLKKLEEIIHPLVQARVAKQRQEFENLGHKVAFYDVPLLFEKGLQDQFDHIVVVIASEEQQIQRVMMRAGMSAEQVKHRISNQLPLIEKQRKADFIIDNSTELDSLPLQVERVLAKMGVTSPKSNQS